MTTVKCEQCGAAHNRKRFCSNKCKDRWHNTRNPRGTHAPAFPLPPLSADERAAAMEQRDHEFAMDAQEDGWDGHKNAI